MLTLLSRPYVFLTKALFYLSAVATFGVPQNGSVAAGQWTYYAVAADLRQRAALSFRLDTNPECSATTDQGTSFGCDDYRALNLC